jgi:hypothetical protein
MTVVHAARACARLLLGAAGLGACLSLARANPTPMQRPGADYRFQSERLRISLADSALDVAGTYVFEAMRSGPEVAVFFPFFRDLSMGAVELLEATVFCGTGDIGRVDVHDIGGQWGWFMRFGDGRRCTVFLHFKQQLLAKRAGYLLTSAGDWPMPPDSISIQFFYPRSLPEPTFNLPLEVLTRSPEGTTYMLRYERTAPKKDLIVTW